MGEAGGTAAAAQIIGGTSSAANGYSQSQAYRGQGRFQRQLANQNAELADLQAQDAMQRSEFEAAKVGLRAQAVKGSQRSTMAAGGVDVNSGSAATIQADTAGLSAIDQLTIKNNAARAAFGYRVSAISDTYQGKMATLSAKTNANSTMLTGGLGFIRSGVMADYYYRKGGGGDDATDYSTPGVS